MLTANRKATESAFKALKAGVSSRPGIPALTGVLLEHDGNGRATFTATDLEVAVRATVDVEGDAHRFLVPFKLLTEAVKLGHGDRVSITNGGDRATVDGGTEIRLLPVEDFPNLSAEAGYVGEVDAAELVKGAETVKQAVSRDEARPVLTGVLLELGGHPGARFVATDSYVLHLAEMYGRGDWKGIIPGRVIEAVRKMLGRKASGTVTLAGTDEEIRFGLPDGTEVVSRLIMGEFPNYQQVIPERGMGTGFRYSLGEVANALKAGALMARDTSPIRLEVVPPLGVKLSASSPDLGSWSGELVDVTVWGDEITAAFNPAYLLGALEAAGDGGTFELRDGLKPGVAWSSDGRRTALVMPVRLPTPIG
jgi:DNA polymerase-3 subunit beta